MKTGFTTVTFRNKSIDENIEIAKNASLFGIEWGGDVHVKAGDCLTAEAVKEKMKAASLSVLSYGSYYRCDGETADEFDSILEAAVILGAPIIRVWAGRISPESADEAYRERVAENARIIADKAIKHGITVAFEYHRGTLTENADSAVDMLERIGRENFKTYWQPNPDLTHEENLDELESIKKYLTAVHVFQWTKGNVRHPLSEGKEEWKNYLSKISDIKDINLIIEFVKDDSEENFCCDALTLRSPSLPRAVFLQNEKVSVTLDKAYDDKTVRELKKKFNIEEKIIHPCELDSSDFSDVEAVFSTWGMPALGEDEIRKFFPSLKYVFYAAGSVQYFARPYLNCGVRVVSAWAANAVPVAECTVSEIILANKGFYTAARLSKEKRRGDASAYYKSFPGNYNVKVGLIGVGMIGSMVAERLKSYDVEVLAYDPFASDEKLDRLGVKRATIEEVFSQCQTVSNHLANNPETVGILDYSLFSKMKKNATFVNTGRGAQVVEEDLIRALTEEPMRTAVLDVTMPEPPREDSQLYTLPNVILTPHLAGSFGCEVARMGQYMLEEAERYLSGEELRYEVTQEMLDTMA